MQKTLVNYSHKSITALILSFIVHGAANLSAIPSGTAKLHALELPVKIIQSQSNQTLKGTKWQLSQWSESQPLTDTPITAEFTDNSLAGSTGCNRYTTTYRTDGQTLTLSPIATTRKACPEPLMRQEFLFVTALEGAQRYFITPQGQLQIVYQTEKGLGIITFEPSPKAQANVEPLP